MDPEHEDPIAAHPSTGAVRLIDVPMDEPGEAPDGLGGHAVGRVDRHRAAPRSPRGGRKGRASMPSWDEIVFGARTDED